RRNLGAVLALLRLFLDRLVAIARDQMDLHRQDVDVGHENLALGVERAAAPIHAAEIAGKRDRAADAWRRVDALGAQLLHLLAARVPVLLRRPPGVLGTETLRHEWRRRDRKRLSRRCPLSLGVALRHGSLLDAKH